MYDGIGRNRIARILSEDVGVDDNKFKVQARDKLIMFPNPLKREISVDFGKANYGCLVVVADMGGKVLAKITTDQDGRANVSISGTEGIYFCNCD
jgi:hypothetical protein